MGESDLLQAKKALLADWEAQRRRLDTLIDALRVELGVSEPAKTEPFQIGVSAANMYQPLNVNELIAPGDFFGMTQVDAIQAFLQRTNKRTASPQEIAQALLRGKAIESPIETDKAFKNLSSLLSKTDAFFSVARGRWGLKEWYPKSVTEKKGAKKMEKDGESPKE